MCLPVRNYHFKHYQRALEHGSVVEFHAYMCEAQAPSLVQPPSLKKKKKKVTETLGIALWHRASPISMRPEGWSPTLPHNALYSAHVTSKSCYPQCVPQPACAVPSRCRQQTWMQASPWRSHSQICPAAPGREGQKKGRKKCFLKYVFLKSPICADRKENSLTGNIVRCSDVYVDKPVGSKEAR